MQCMQCTDARPARPARPGGRATDAAARRAGRVELAADLPRGRHVTEGDAGCQ